MPTTQGDSAGPLAPARVVDATTGIAGAYCTKLLRAGGAEVIKVESPTGDPLRAWSASGSEVDPVVGAPLFRFLHHGKQSVVVPESGGDDELFARLGPVDVLVVGPAGPLTAALDAALCGPSTVRLSITPYGSAGPYSDRLATDFTVQAEAGCILARGRAEDEPLQLSGRMAEWITGTFGAVAVASALREARRSGMGESIDLSIAEAVTIASSQYSNLKQSLLGNPPLDKSYRFVETPSIEPTADGYVGFTTNSREQFDNFLLLIERADLLGDEDLAAFFGRQQRWDEWTAIVKDWTTKHTTAEIVELAAALRVPVAPVNSGADVAQFPHLVERHVYRHDPLGEFVMPRAPWLIDGVEAEAAEPSPLLGEHTETVGRPAERRVPPTAAGEWRLPLEGVRVIDMSSWWAGPFGAGVLAALGADVIHIEAPARFDGMRATGGTIRRDGAWWELSPHFLSANTNKRSLVVDLSTEAGMAVLLRLVEVSDLLVENFAPRVIERFGLSWDVVHERNPRCSLVRMPAFGLSGPWRDHTGFAQTMEQLSGLAWMTGHRDDQPRVQGGPSDPNAGLHGAYAALLALARRDTTGEGCFVEVPMIEAALNAAAELVIEHSANGVVLQRLGNRAPRVAPQGLYPCTGFDSWLAISVETHAQWRALRRVLGEPGWAFDERFDTVEGRWKGHDRIDEHLRAWAAPRDARVTAELLVDHGVPAALARDPRTLHDHPQFVARGFYEVFEHPVAGGGFAPGLPFRFGHVDRWVRTPAPRFGRDNREILQDLLGLQDADIDDLHATGVVADTPRL